MRPSELKSVLTSRFKAGVKRSVLIEGSPGVGKTQVCEQVAKELGIGYMCIHAPLLQPEDYGFPVVNKDRTDVDFIVSTHKFPLQGSDIPETGIFNIDEIPQADASGQKILANLVQAREIHGHKIKPGWMIVGTGNRVTDRAGASRILSHLGNRVCRLAFDASLDDWCDWAHMNKVNPEIISFIRWRPELLNKFDPQMDINPTPRAWAEGVNTSLGVVAPNQELPVFTGDVGEGPAAELCAFLKIYRNLPNIEDILEKPLKTKIPDGPAVMYALCGALGAKITPATFDASMQYVRRLPGEFVVLFIRDVLKRTPEIKNSEAFRDWASTDGVKCLAVGK